jgi:hypothetical protein
LPNEQLFGAQNALAALPLEQRARFGPAASFVFKGYETQIQ